MNQTIFGGIRGDNKNFIVLLYDFDLCQNSTHGKLHSSKAEQCGIGELENSFFDVTNRLFMIYNAHSKLYQQKLNETSLTYST